MDGMIICLEATYFQWGGTFFKQVFGTAMGSPISAAIANLVMEQLEGAALNKLPNHIQIPFHKRFVDDSILSVPMGTVDSVIEHFQSYHPRLKFTYETEVEGSLSFLDVLVTRDGDGSLSTDWYRKPTRSGRYLSFQSHHPVSQKLGVARALYNRTTKILSRPNQVTSALNVAQSTLEKNGFPTTIINKAMRPFKAKVEKI